MLGTYWSHGVIPFAKGVDTGMTYICLLTLLVMFQVTAQASSLPLPLNGPATRADVCPVELDPKPDIKQGLSSLSLPAL